MAPAASETTLKVVLDASSMLRGVDRARMALLPAEVLADLGGMVARWRLERGLSDEPASATDLAMMILSLPGIGQGVMDAYLRGTGVIVRVVEPPDVALGAPERRVLRALDPVRLTVEVRNDAAEEQQQVGQGSPNEGRRAD